MASCGNASDSALESMRKPYLDRDQILDSNELESLDPHKIWKDWFDQATQVIKEVKSPNESNQMALATSTKNGKPSVRYILLKGYDETGFYFYTNYNSRKGKELEENPQASMCFYWPEVHRMVTIEGDITRVSPERSDAYFKSRPVGSQIGALASQQSSVLPSREALEERRRELESQVSGGTDMKRPEHWGGYRLAPRMFEFWQGQRDRLHDRLRFTAASNGAWACERLAP